MGILDKSKRMYKVSGARMNSSPPRVIKVHLKSHVHLNNNLQDSSSLYSSSLESNLQSEDSAMITSHNSLAEAAIEPPENEVDPKESGTPLQQDRIRKSFPSDISERELAFRLAFPTAMRNMLIANGSISDRKKQFTPTSQSGSGSNNTTVQSDRCRGSKIIISEDATFGRRPSLRSATHTRSGTWCINRSPLANNVIDQHVWPRGRFFSLTEKKVVPIYQNKVEITWNDSYSQNNTFIKNETAPIVCRTPVAHSVRNRKKSSYHHNNAGQIRSVLGTPSPPQKNKLRSVFANCCM